MTACIGEPISWPRLERYALDGHDAAIAQHLSACKVCAGCLEDIRRDVVALPPLAVPERKPRFRWWLAIVPALAAAALLFVLWPRQPRPPENVATIKGVGELVLGVVRERDGAIREDVLTYQPADRWKLVVTCPPAATTWIDLAVLDAGTVDHPLPPTRIACGNRVVVPGAFSLTGDRPNRLCIRVASEPDPARPPPRAGEPDVACLTIRPEPPAQ